MRIDRRGRRPCRLLRATTLALLLSPGLSLPARADGPASRLRPFPSRAASSPPGAAAARAPGSGSWWVGTAGVALALAACGWGSVAARKYLPKAGFGLALGQGASPLRVVGRTSLSPRHSVYLLDTGGRVLIVGTGPQGAPTLLGELTEPEALARLSTRPSSPIIPPARFDHMVGDDA